MKSKVVLHEGKDGWRWKLVASNGKTTAGSMESFDSFSNAKRGVSDVLSDIVGAEILLEEVSTSLQESESGQVVYTMEIDPEQFPD